MLHPALAIAWPLWRRHRWGLLVVLGFVGAVSLASAVLPALSTPAVAPSVLGPLTLPLVLVFLYLLGIFSYGFDADVADARESCFPISLFRLPVRTEVLVGWPMAFGASAVVLFWLATASLLLQPWLGLWGVTVPLWWPAMLGAACLAWLQALLWSPCGLPGMRIVLLVGLIAALVALAQVSVASGASEGFLVGLFAALAAAGWLSGYCGVRKARCGDAPDWEGLLRPWRQLAALLPRGRERYASAAQAQLVFEWRRGGMSLPVATGLVLPITLFPLLFGKNDALPTAHTLLGTLAIPVFIAGMAGTTVSGGNLKGYYGIASFIATLPMTTAAMVAAKLKAAFLSTLLTWGLLALTVSLAVVLTGNLEEVTGWWRQSVDAHHPLKVIAGIVTAATLLVVWTWKRLVDSVFLGLSGRERLAHVTVVASMIAFIVVCGVAAWIARRPQFHEAALTVLPWLLGLLLLCRLVATAWALRQVLRRNLVSALTLRRLLMAWLLLASVLFAILTWVVPEEMVPWYYLAFAVLQAMPMAHVAATPLALASNRHR